MTISSFYSLKTAFAAVGSLMVIATVLQLSLVSSREWNSLFARMDKVKEGVKRMSLSQQERFSFRLYKRTSSVGDVSMAGTLGSEESHQPASSKIKAA